MHETARLILSHSHKKSKHFCRPGENFVEVYRKQTVDLGIMTGDGSARRMPEQHIPGTRYRGYVVVCAIIGNYSISVFALGMLSTSNFKVIFYRFISTNSYKSNLSINLTCFFTYIPSSYISKLSPYAFFYNVKHIL